MYGSRTDALNAGLATDRLIAEWDTSGDIGGRTSTWPDAIELIEVKDALACGVRQIPSGAEHLCLEIPARINDVKSLGTGAAVDWQRAEREAFQRAFEMGYQVVGFTRADRPRYLLEHKP